MADFEEVVDGLLDPPQDKVVLVISFDAPQNENEFKATVGKTMDALKDTLENAANRHVWMGVGEAGAEVLNVIGVD